MSEHVEWWVDERACRMMSKWASKWVIVNICNICMKVKFSSMHMNKRRFYQQKRDTVQKHMNKHRFYQQKQIAV